jgi:hypothetical protein
MQITLRGLSPELAQRMQHLALEEHGATLDEMM